MRLSGSQNYRYSGQLNWLIRSVVLGNSQAPMKVTMAKKATALPRINNIPLTEILA